MSDFSQKYHPLFKDSLSSSSVFPPTSPIKMLGILEEPNIINVTPFSQFYQPDEYFDDFPDNDCVHETGTCSPQSSKVINNNSTSVCTKINCPNSSPNPLDKVEQASQLVHSPIHNKKRKNKESPSSISSQLSNKDNTSMKEMKGKKQKKDKKKAPEETPTSFIHVRARRGQATDSHSLAERVRREKISERMKVLQGLVPGCDKVNGKALMLDEIINYVQSLQHQVEFLTMKLTNVNPMYYDFGMDVDTLMITTNKQRLSALASLRPLPPPPPPSMQPIIATHQIPMPNTVSSLTTSSIVDFFDNLALFPIQQEHLPNISSRGSGQLLDLDEQIIQKLVNQQLSQFTSY